MNDCGLSQVANSSRHQRSECRKKPFHETRDECTTPVCLNEERSDCSIQAVRSSGSRVGVKVWNKPAAVAPSVETHMLMCHGRPFGMSNLGTNAVSSLPDCSGVRTAKLGMMTKARHCIFESKTEDHCTRR